MLLSSSFCRWLETQGLILPPPNTPPRALAQAWGGDLGSLVSRSTFGVARVLSAVWVFLCHSFYPVHYWFGFFSVVAFFFISGYGMCVTRSRDRALLRLPRFIAVLFFFSLLYYVAYRSFFYPTRWFLISYASVMVLYYYFGRSIFTFVFSFVLYAVLLVLLDFELNYIVCPFGFLFGYIFFYYRSFFSWSVCLSLFFFSLLFIFYPFPYFVILAIPLFVRLYFGFCSWFFLYTLSRFSLLVFPFFSLHCWFLALFDSTWTMETGQSYLGSFFAFIFSVLGAFVLYRFVPLFSKKKFWIFQ